MKISILKGTGLNLRVEPTRIKLYWVPRSWDEITRLSGLPGSLWRRAKTRNINQCFLDAIRWPTLQLACYRRSVSMWETTKRWRVKKRYSTRREHKLVGKVCKSFLINNKNNRPTGWRSRGCFTNFFSFVNIQWSCLTDSSTSFFFLVSFLKNFSRAMIFFHSTWVHHCQRSWLLFVVRPLRTPWPP